MTEKFPFFNGNYVEDKTQYVDYKRVDVPGVHYNKTCVRKEIGGNHYFDFITPKI